MGLPDDFGAATSAPGDFHSSVLWWRSRCLLLTCAALWVTPVRAEQGEKPSSPPSPGAEIVATIGARPITDAQLEEMAKDRLVRIRNEEYNIKRRVLDDYITQVLFEQEAAARGISVEELEKREIDGKMVPVTDDQKRAVYDSNRQQFLAQSKAQALAQIEEDLRRFRRNEARRTLLAALRAKSTVKVLLAPPRIAMSEGHAPAIGPKDAPVTIVAFSEFQCPACGRAFPSVKRLLQQYPGKVRFVFRDFPLPMHTHAAKAAEAAACADEQGKFWEMHDRLFTNQQALQVPDLKRHAAELGLDTQKFDACLESGKRAADWNADLEAGRKLGINSTPTFFVNGRMLTGAVPYPALVEIVEQELTRRGETPLK